MIIVRMCVYNAYIPVLVESKKQLKLQVGQGKACLFNKGDIRAGMKTISRSVEGVCLSCEGLDLRDVCSRRKKIGID